MVKDPIKKFKKQYWLFFLFGFFVLIIFLLGMTSGVLFSSYAATTSSGDTAAPVPAFTVGISVLAMGAIIKLKGRMKHG